MPQRNQQLPAILTIIGLAVCLFLANLLIGILSDHPGSILLTVNAIVAGVIAIVGATIFFRVILPSHRQNTLFERIDAITDEHINSLIGQQTTLMRWDVYGNPKFDKWLAEVNHFVTNHVRPALEPKQCNLLERERDLVVQCIAQRVAVAAQRGPNNRTTTEQT
jgi:hypothetical protein